MAVVLTRRQLARGAAASAAGAALGPSRPAAAKGTLRQVHAGELGTTLVLGLANAPFPFGDAPYDDDSCVVFVPTHHRAAHGRIDALVHLHGHGTTARKTMVEKQLREQFHASGQDAILVLPQGPIDAKDSRWGKLAEPEGLLRLLGELRRTLQHEDVAAALGESAMPAAGRIGQLVLSAHSGGYRGAAACLQHGGFDVREMWLFDALYGEREAFRQWVLQRRERTGAHERHKLLAFYAVDKVAAQCRALREELEHDGVAFVHATDDRALSRTAMTRARVAFVRSSASHREVMHANDALRDALRWSCFAKAAAAPRPAGE